MSSPDSSSTTTTTPADQTVSIRERVPRRVLHFSDGTIEEFSDEENETVTDSPPEAIDESKMAWIPWLRLKAVHTGDTILGHCDTAGEALASALGITSPKYEYELDAYRRLEKERAAQAHEDDVEAAGAWTAPAAEGDQNGVMLVTTQEEVGKY